MNEIEQPMPSSAFFMWRLFTYRPWPQVVSGCCWIIFHSWALWPGLLAKAFFDLLTGEAPAGLTLPTLIALLLGLALIRVGAVYLDVFVGNKTGLRIRGLIQRNLLARILERPGARALPTSVGEALSTLRDDVETMWGAGWAFDVLAYLIFALGGLAILLWVSVRVTLLVFLPIVAVLVLAHRARTQLQHVREASRAATAQVTGALGEIFGAAQAIQVAGAEAHVIAHLRQLSANRRQAMLRDQWVNLALNAAFANIAGLGAGLTMLVAATALRSGEFTIGDFALFATYLMQVTEMTGFLGWMVATYQQTGVAFRRAVALLQGAPAATLVAHHPVPLTEPLPPLPVVVKEAEDVLEELVVRDLTLHYPDGTLGIADISFTLPCGSLTVITGRIGAGKTTLVRTLLGLLTPTHGALYWNGKPITTPATWCVPPRVAYIPQTPTLLSGTLRENILLGLAADEAHLTQAIHHAVLERDLAEFPAGLETVIGARGVRLSGGQIQRTAAARMFVRALGVFPCLFGEARAQGSATELLILDDLSSALDVETEQLLWQRLLAGAATTATQNGRPGMAHAPWPQLPTTYLVVSHRPAVLERADQILLLESGRLT
ncbi:MAG: ABC transporter ATP-binding protein [Caldilineaceae bacterium]